MISSWISGEVYLCLLLVLHCSYMFGKYWVSLCLYIQNCHNISWLQSMTVYTAIFYFLNFQQYMLVLHYLGLFKFWEFVNYRFIFRIFGCDLKENIWTYNSYINRYPFFISLYKTLHRKRMDADQHCGVLVKAYNIFKMQS